LGGAPLKLFTCIYGTPEGRITPFTKPLTTFYKTPYATINEVNSAFETIFHTKLEQESDRSYFDYIKPRKMRPTRRIKRKSTKTKKNRTT
jgi:hypothetical protein